MKQTKIFIYAAVALMTCCIQSCLDYDNPGDEFIDKESQVIEPPVISSGKADVIDYKKTISDAGAKAAYKALRGQLGSAQTGIYGLRGGKEGGTPVPHAYQFLFSLGPDAYVQYHCVPHSDFPYSEATLRSTYDISKKFIGGPGGGFGSAKTNIAPVLNAEKIDSLPEMKALYLVLFNYAAIENVDLFGPMPYNDHKNLKETSPFEYNDVRTIYYSAKANIDSAINCFKYYSGNHMAKVTKEDGSVVEELVPNRSDAYKKLIHSTVRSRIPLLRFESYEKDNMDVWVRFANSLKLRMAIHMTEVEPQTAKQWAEEAVASGVIESANQEVALFTSLLGSPHPLVQIIDWHDVVLGASFISMMESLDHPYMKYLVTKNEVGFTKSGNNPASSAPATTAQGSVFVGMRAGATPGIGQAPAQNPLAGFSAPKKEYMTEKVPPLYLMKLSEVMFLRAEGAVRGWDMGGSAQQFYEQGIRYAYFEDRNMASQSPYTTLVDDYLKLSTPKPYTYVDPTGETPDMPSVTKIGVAWNSANGDKEKQLEMIITQKYIASWPYSYEPFVDLRRTGYPKLFPVLNVSDADGSIQKGNPLVQSWENIMRRIPWASDDPQTKADIEATGLPALAKDADAETATDTQMQRLWWDKSAKK